MLLLPIETYSKGQRQNDFQTLVEKYQQKLATSITMLCAHNYDKDPFTIRLSKEQLDMIKDGYKARGCSSRTNNNDENHQFVR